MKPATRNVLVVLVVLALLVGGGSAVWLANRAHGPTRSDPAGDAPSDELARFYSQELSWEPCEGQERFDCAGLEVPLDYADPAGETIELALLRDPADDQDARIGSLVVNPGGPGAPGTQYASYEGWAFGPPLRERYDIVGFDPRGVQGSAPVDCVDDAELDAYLAVDPVPDDPGEVRELVGAAREMAAGCDAQAGDVAAHVSTVEAARDMDVLRAALGEDRLAYLGVSYGTKLGATYASLFPERTGRFVLDAALDPDADSLEVNLTQAEGFEVALRSYVSACVEEGECFLGDTVEAGVARVQQILASIDRRPLPAGERTLHVGNAFYGVIMPLYSEASWPMLDNALQGAIDGDGRGLLELSDMYSSRGPDGYTDNSTEANWAINCLDTSAEGDEPWTPAQVRDAMPEFEEASPTFGPTLAWMMTGCTGRTAQAAEPAPQIAAEGADPILVVGTTRDPATPYRWAEALADKLDSGVLVTRDGDGHGGYMTGNSCVDDAVEEYLVAGEVPEDGLTC